MASYWLAAAVGARVLSITTAVCEDDETWRSSTGLTCADWAAGAWCNDKGQPGPGWNPMWAEGTYDIAYYANQATGLSPADACCACRGGSDIFTTVEPTTTTLEPTTTTLSSGCADDEAWRSRTGFTCADWTRGEWCNSHGLPGPGWGPDWADSTFDIGFYTNPTTNVSPADACCACGGGSKAGNEYTTDGDEDASTSSPSSPTVSSAVVSVTSSSSTQRSATSSSSSSPSASRIVTLSPGSSSSSSSWKSPSVTSSTTSSSSSSPSVTSSTTSSSSSSPSASRTATLSPGSSSSSSSWKSPSVTSSTTSWSSSSLTMTTDPASTPSACHALGWRSRDVGGRLLCGASKLNGRCHSAMSWEVALNLCNEVGGRLCSASELAADVAMGTGCGFDVKSTWTNELCASGHLVVGGSSKLSGHSGCVGEVNNVARAVRCCAGALPATSFEAAVPPTTSVPGEPTTRVHGCGLPAPVRSVQACSDLVPVSRDWSFRPARLENPGTTPVCAASKAKGRCMTAMTPLEAGDACAALGGRLCRSDELASDVARGSYVFSY